MDCSNPLLATDVYKLGHMTQYPDNTKFVFSYMEARRPDIPVVFFGLQYYLQRHLSKLTFPLPSEVDEICELHQELLNPSAATQLEFRNKLTSLLQLGYWPLAIVAPKEGTITKSQNCLLGITNTVAGYGWLVGYFETLLLKLWNSCTVATHSAAYRALVENYLQLTSTDQNAQWLVHDFGARGVSSEETAAISGAAHLLSFTGTDNVQAAALLKECYKAKAGDYGSIAASEHSVMCSYGPHGEETALAKLLETDGPVSIVADTYDYFNWLESVLPKFKTQILNREHKTVIRPDSGIPKEIILQTLPILAELFGCTVNAKGYKELHPKIGLIYGDGMHYDTFKEVLEAMRDAGWATSNLVIGVGGLLLQNHSRDDFGFSLKASAITFQDKQIGDYHTQSLMKNPKTDTTKVSKAGVMQYKESFAQPYTTACTVYRENDTVNNTHAQMVLLWQENTTMVNYFDLKTYNPLLSNESWSNIKSRFNDYYNLPEVKESLLKLRKKQYVPSKEDRKCV